MIRRDISTSREVATTRLTDTSKSILEVGNGTDEISRLFKLDLSYIIAGLGIGGEASGYAEGLCW